MTPEQQIALLKEQLGQAQKLTALGELVSTTTHEFNNLLMTILNYARMGLRHRDEATRTRALEKILGAGERAAQITGAVLGMARNRRSAKAPTQLAEIVRQTMLLMEREFAKYRIALELDLQSSPDVHCDGNQIQQVLLNLLINARQAMQEGGSALVRVAPDPATGMVDLVVRDTGRGIDRERLPRIFEPFYSTKDGPDASGKGGTGLGLSLCREIVESHRGRIRVESTPGRGTCFTIKLPVSTAEAAA